MNIQKPVHWTSWALCVQTDPKKRTTMGIVKHPLYNPTTIPTTIMSMVEFMKKKKEEIYRFNRVTGLEKPDL